MKNNNSFINSLFHTYCVPAPLCSWSTQLAARERLKTPANNYAGAEGTLLWKGLGGHRATCEDGVCLRGPKEGSVLMRIGEAWRIVGGDSGGAAILTRSSKAPRREDVRLLMARHREASFLNRSGCGTEGHVMNPDNRAEGRPRRAVQVLGIRAFILKGKESVSA